MSSTSATSLLGLSPALRHHSVSTLPANGHAGKLFWPTWKGINFRFCVHCSTVFRPLASEYVDVPHKMKWEELLEGGVKKETSEVIPFDRIRENVKHIRSMLWSMNDGEISISAYDTAWVALVEDLKGNGGPQFPSSLEWIANNQLADGSWGDNKTFLAHDRLLNTLACIVALKSWNMHPQKVEKGLLFIRNNIHKLEYENAEHMPIGFEVAFPSLIEIARGLDIHLPKDSTILQDIYERRNLKLRRIPNDMMHRVPTTLLYSLEGMPNLNWEKLLPLKCSDGSFLFSPSSTAFALMETKEENCLRYLTRIVERFNGGVPNVYPVDMFEHIWAVDRLQRLGIARYFKPEIEACTDYVYRYWTDEGICWARNSRVQDVDDTAMGFRILRLHGYQVSPNVFQQFERDGEFCCFGGQPDQAVTGMYNLFRASEVMFPGETILARAKKFTSPFLQERRENNQLLDKWIISKDLPGEVGYALDVPWYANLPRLETRFYLEQYGGEHDVWIGKTLYRMPNVNNNTYLELGKSDYNNCQAVHQLEWLSIQRWYVESGLGELGLSERSLLQAYYVAAATTFEPEKSNQRLAWAKTTALMEAIRHNMKVERWCMYDDGHIMATAFLHEFQHFTGLDYFNGESHTPTQRLLRTLFRTVNQISKDAATEHGKDIHQSLLLAWEKWLIKLQDRGQGEAELIVRTLDLCAGLNGPEEILWSHPKYQQLLNLTSRVCHPLFQLQHQKVQDIEDGRGEASKMSIDVDMQQLVKLVFSKSSNDIDCDNKQTFLSVAKSFYYIAHCNQATLDLHISKVLFERVL